MDEIKLSRLVGLPAQFTDSDGNSRRVIVTRHNADAKISHTAIEGYSATLLEQYFTNLAGTRMEIFPPDRIVAL